MEVCDLNNMSGEVDYRLTKILLADLRLRETRLNESEVNRALIERFNPPLGFLEEDTPFDQTVEEFSDLITKRMVCGKCGRFFSSRLWHSTSYHNRVYECLSRSKKGQFCGNWHIYEKNFPLEIGAIIWEMMRKRHTVELFVMKSYSLFDEETLGSLYTNLESILNEGLKGFTPEWNGMNYIVSKMVITDTIIETTLSDGTSYKHELIHHRPKEKRK